MSLDPELCYRALVSRDLRFDGRFFTGVLTTGIYCRPGCPARIPAQRNVRFYATAAAAEAEGFRPCLRCRPETAPGSAAARGTHATVTRALRLIDEGALDEGSVETLASRLGVTDRWLRQLFAGQLGASPLDVAQTRRAHLARRLLDETRLPLAEVALAAGFAGERQLRRAVQHTFRRPPSALRGAGAASRDAALTLRLPARPPFDAVPLLEFIGARAIPGVETVERQIYRRSVVVDGVRALLEVEAMRDGVTLRLTPPVPRALPRVVARVTRMFDLEADAAAIAAHLSADALLRRALRGRAVRVPGAWDAFELGVRALLGQQVSVAAARTLAGRLVRLCGTPLLAPRGAITHVFPVPVAVAAAPLERLGLTRARAAALRGFARAVAKGTLDLEGLRGLDDAVERLTALPGIGEWTAQYLAMRGLAEPDALPASDLGVRKALIHRGRMPGVRQVIARAERWRPWRSYAVFALWTSLAAPRRRKGST